MTDEKSLPDGRPTEPADVVEAIWARSGEPPDLSRLLEEHRHWSPRDLWDALLVDQQYRWRTPRPWTTEGIICRTWHRSLKRVVALKMIRPERLMRAADLRRFKNETRIIARLNHPNIIPILDVGKVDGVRFFTMQMVHGRDLEARRNEYLTEPARATRLVWAPAGAIHHAHQHGVLRRDLKPSNGLVDAAGVPYVVDFGLARHVSEPSDLTAADEFLGTPAYAAPEQLQGESQPLTVAADIYGLGAILYVLITGRAPFTGNNLLELWKKIREEEPQAPRRLNACVDPDLQAVCLKALDKDPAARYPSAAALADDLQRYPAHEPVAARPSRWWQRRWRWVRRHPARAVFAVCGSAVAIGLLGAIAILAVLPQEEMRQARQARIEAEEHHAQMEVAQAEAEQLRAAAAGDRHWARETKYVADLPNGRRPLGEALSPEGICSAHGSSAGTCETAVGIVHGRRSPFPLG